MNLRRMSTVSILFLALALTALPTFAADAPAGGGPKVNINTASAAQLALLPRVGPALAERIVAHRDENGPFAAPGDLVLVRGIGERTFATMEAYVTVKGDTTLTEKVRPVRVAADETER